jgi:hypothetical protein
MAWHTLRKSEGPFQKKPGPTPSCSSARSMSDSDSSREREQAGSASGLGCASGGASVAGPVGSDVPFGASPLRSPPNLEVFRTTKRQA